MYECYLLSFKVAMVLTCPLKIKISSLAKSQGEIKSPTLVTQHEQVCVFSDHSSVFIRNTAREGHQTSLAHKPASANSHADLLIQQT